MKVKEGEKLSGELASLRSEHDRLQGEKEALDNQVAGLQSERSDLEKARTDLQLKNQSLENELTQLKEDNLELEEILRAKSDTLSKNIVDLRDHVADLKKENSLLNEKNKALNQNVKTLEKDKSLLQGQSRDLSENVEALEKNVETLKMEGENSLLQIEALQEENEALRTKTEALERQRAEQLKEMKDTYENLLEDMKSEIAKGEITITQLKGKLKVNMLDEILFDSGKTTIKTKGVEVLKRVGNILLNVKDRAINIEGHTDNVPIGAELGKKYPTNWELSAARATNVARYLQERIGIEPGLLSATGYGEYQPVASNDIEEGRAKNRRIEIVLVPREIVPVSRK
jgi:chemotaxis protein MotB